MDRGYVDLGHLCVMHQSGILCDTDQIEYQGATHLLGTGASEHRIGLQSGHQTCVAKCAREYPEHLRRVPPANLLELRIH